MIQFMPFHVYMFEPFDRLRPRGKAFHFLNLTEEHLRERIVGSWDRGDPITWDGETADSTKSTIEVFRTSDPINRGDVAQGSLYKLMSAGENVTNDWITGAAGARPPTYQGRGPNRRRNPHFAITRASWSCTGATGALATQCSRSFGRWGWTRSSGSRLSLKGMASPHNLDTVRAAMDVGQAVVVVLTAEDRAGLLPELAAGDDEDVALRGQPRQNVILEAGLAMGVDRSRTILVELGAIRRTSDFDGLNVVRLTNETPRRNALRSRLVSAGCAVDEGASDWMRPESGGDFDAAPIAWTSTAGENPPAD